MKNEQLFVSDINKMTNIMELMRMHAPDVLERKIPESLCQSAHMLSSLLGFKSSRILCVGCAEDVPYAVLNRLNFNITGIDPTTTGTDLHTFVESKPGVFDVVFATSVIEHAQDDTLFIKEMCSLLGPGGSALMTCDFKPGWKPGSPLPGNCYRMYTNEKLMSFKQVLQEQSCKFSSTPKWNLITEETLDFMFEGIKYAFAGIYFRKK